jgi:lipopolysaccharide biosynthesis glycosyltransferase
MNLTKKQFFVFLHIGDDPNVDLMVRSINSRNQNAYIIQCSDNKTKKIDGASDIFRVSADTTNLMTFRLQAFSNLKLKEPAIYLDTDMLVLKSLDTHGLIGNSEVVCCKRSFGLNDIVNTSFRGMDLSEYRNKTLGEIYPILASFTITKSFEFWSACLKNLLELDKKFHWWYGDQEAMRNVANSNQFAISYLPESTVACLPEFFNNNNPPMCLHFKGSQRKAWMREIFHQLKYT